MCDMTTTSLPIDSAPSHDSSPAPATPATTSRRHRFIRGNDSDPRWVRPALLVLLAGTALLYLWNLGASGWGNSFYSAAAQAGSVNWEAFFYGSSDAANSITVDKTPASLWVMALSVRLFGLNSWSILVPQALMGVATVGLLYATVRRAIDGRTLTRPDEEGNAAATPAPSWSAPTAALLSGAILALTPVAVLMFKFNNPDALLVLLLVAAVYAFTRACEKAGTWWLVAVGALIGFGFLTKMLQALLIVPVLAIIYLIVAPNRLRTRFLQLMAAGLALLVSAGWWIAVVEFMPTGMRPYIGGSQTNSVMELVLGYNGLGRLTGDETGSVVPGGGSNGAGGGVGGMWGETGIGRMFNSEIGGQVAWLIPAAVILGFAALWLTRRAKRTDATRTALLVWGGWLAVTMLVFSFMQGIFHAYYTVALAPAIGAVVGIAAVLLWERKDSVFVGTVMAATVLVTAGWAFVLLNRSSEFVPWLAPVVLILGFLVAFAIATVSFLPPRVAAAVGIAAIIVGLAGPTAYAVQTAASPHSGSIPTAGPTVAGGMGGPGGMRGPGGQGGPGAAGGQNFAPPTGAQGFGGNPPPGLGQMPGSPGTAGTTPGGVTTGRAGGPGGGGAGGLLDSTTPSAALTALLSEDAANYTWVAAAIGSQNASGYQLATQEPVMPIGGFNGSDPSPTLDEFKELVAQGKIHYFIGGQAGGPGGQSGSSAQITEWVQANFTAQTIDGTTLYDLTQSST